MKPTPRIPAIVFACLCGANLAAAQEDPTAQQGLTWKDLFNSGSSLKLYGFLRLDAAYDSERFNDPQIPYFVRSPDPAAPVGTGAAKGLDEFTMHARLTRLGLLLDAGEVDGLGNPDLSGKVEVDFYNIGLGDSDSRSAIRMRLAYLDLDWDGFSLLAEQDWDVISPLYPVVNNDLVMWGAGNLGDRRPQLTAKYDAEIGQDHIVTEAGIALTGAVGGSTVSGGLRSGEASGQPMFNARVGWHGSCESGPYQLGLWGHFSKERFVGSNAVGAGKEDYDSHSTGLDLRVPLFTKKLALQGEYFMGKNLRDVRGGILQGVNATTNKGIESQGGWAELMYQATEAMALYIGYSVDGPENSDLSQNMLSRNSIPYVAARWRVGDVRFGLEYLNWTTDHVGLADGDAHRVAAWIAYYF
jgi:hypothetical protein